MISKFPSNGLLEMVWNLPSFFRFKKFQQIRSLEAFKISAKMGRGWQADWAMAKIFCQICANMWWTNAENFKKIPWFLFELYLAEWLRICCNSRPTLGNCCWCFPRVGLLLQTQTACQPRPILAETLDASSNRICWDISKRKKLVRF